MIAPALLALIPASITSVALSYGLDPVLVQALSNRELADGRLVSDPNANGSRDYGPMQVNDHTLPLLGGRWTTMDPQRLADEPALGIEAGCIVLRWRLLEAARADGITVHGYADLQAALGRLTPLGRRGVYARAVAAYRGGDVAMRDWPNVDGLTLVYVGRMLMEYERLQKGD